MHKLKKQTINWKRTQSFTDSGRFLRPHLVTKLVLMVVFYTIRMVQSRQFIEPGLGVSTYLDFGARLFSTQWPPYGAHILQGLIYITIGLLDFVSGVAEYTATSR